MKTVPITVTMPADLVSEVNRIAKAKKVSRSKVVSDALKRSSWLWRLDRLQKMARPYALSLRIRSEKDVERFLGS